MPKVLLTDDDRDLIDVLSYAFRHNGYEVAAAFDGEQALGAIDKSPPDLLILDLMMPKRDGMQVLEALCGRRNVPTIVLTALGDEDHVVQALELGADDYMVKPFRPRELLARAQAVLRRTRDQEAEIKTWLPLTLGDLRLDPATVQVTLAGRPVQLTRVEFALLHYLMLNRNMVVRLPDIIANVWGYDSEVNDDVVKTNISRLRRKIEADPSQPHLIVNVPGLGYKFQSK
jgi:DNA-binding response OmpR family regulator